MNCVYYADPTQVVIIAEHDAARAQYVPPGLQIGGYVFIFVACIYVNWFRV
jgi:hypothetical protein